MTAHARLSPSSSKRWFACPGSVTLEAALPDKRNTYADAGTAMHDVAAQCLNQNVDASIFTGRAIAVKEGDSIDFTDEMAELVQGYVDTVRAMVQGHTLLVEQCVDFSWAIDVPDSFGTADTIIWDADNGEMIVMDLKTGHTPVTVEKNSQLMLYALGALKQLVEENGDAASEEDSLV